MPFEGAGAVSDWQLSLPGKFRQFDYQTISDLILHISYTAEFDPDLRNNVYARNGSLVDYLTNQSFKRTLSLRQDFSNAFHKLVHSPINTEVKIDLSAKYFPMFLSAHELKVEKAQLALKTNDGQSIAGFELAVNATTPPGYPDTLGGLASADVKAAFDSPLVGEHKLTVTNAGDLAAPVRPGHNDAIDADKLRDVLLHIEYKVKDPSA